MNRVYRSVFCQATQTWVAVSELAPARSKSGSLRLSLVALAAITVMGSLGTGEAQGASFYFQGALNRSDSGAGNYLNSSNLSMSLAGDDNDNCGSVSVAGRTNVPGAVGTGTLTAAALYGNVASNAPGLAGVNTTGRTVWDTYTTSQVWGSSGNLGSAGGYANAIGTAEPRAFGVGSFVVGCGATATGNYSAAVGMAGLRRAGAGQWRRGRRVRFGGQCRAGRGGLHPGRRDTVAGRPSAPPPARRARCRSAIRRRGNTARSPAWRPARPTATRSTCRS